MDKLTGYRDAIERKLQEHADLMNSQPVPGEEVDCVFDETRDQYLLLKYGRPRGRRAHYTKVHARIHDGKIWIEEDLTEDGFARDLLDAGVPREDIILAFVGSKPLSLSELAVA